MEVVRGVVLSAQEGRFLLAAADGRTHLLMLAPSAGVEAQDLPELVRRACRVSVECCASEGRMAKIAHRLHEL